MEAPGGYDAVMGKSFLPDQVNQTLLFPPSLHAWLPEGHLARFLVDVVSALDLSAIYASYDDKDGRGGSAYSPEMMLRVLLYGYARGVYSSRKIEARTYEEVAFRYLSGDQHPDHDSFAEFRKRHLEALAGLFTQALLLCEKAGLVKLGHVAIDGTKIKANASKHKAQSYARMGETEARLKQEIEALLKQAEDVDAAEDAHHGKGKRGDELAEELARRESRLKKIAAAKAELEQEAREKAEQERAEAEAKLAKRRQEQQRTGKKKRGREPQVPDPDKPQPASADTGYWSEANVTDESVADIDLHIATGRDKREEVVAMASGPPPDGATAKEAMRHKLSTEAGRAVYKMRKAIVEPVFGQIKERRGFRRFSLRGLKQVGCEWKLVCAVSNLRKLHGSGWTPQPA